jgi:hypothetical protein
VSAITPPDASLQRSSVSPGRVLVRHFVTRFIENDLVSPDADRHEVMAVVGAALIALSLFVTCLLSVKYLFDPFPSPARTALAAIGDRALYVGWSMTLMALLAVVTWDALDLDDRDAANLGPLPIPHRTILGAKLTAVLVFVAAGTAALNIVPTVLHPMLMAGRLRIGVSGLVTLTLAHAATTGAAAVIGFCSVLALKEACRLVLGQTMFKRLSGWLQATAAASVAGAILFLPAASTGIARASLAAEPALPPVCFVALFESLSSDVVIGAPRSELPPSVSTREDEAATIYASGRRHFRRLGAVALLGLAAVSAVSLIGYGWNHRRLAIAGSVPRRRASPIGALVSSTARRLIVRHAVSEAAFWFSLRCLWRSVPHRLSMATAVGLGFAAATAGLYDTALSRYPQIDAVPAGVMALQNVLLLAALLGFRHATRIPVEQSATWTFQMAWSGNELRWTAGVRRAATAFVCLPAILVTMPIHVMVLGPSLAVAHSSAGLLIGLIVIEVIIRRHEGPPFASAPAPGENSAAWGPIAVVVLILAAYGLALVARVALASASGTATFLLVLLASWLGVRMIARRHTRSYPFEFGRAAHGEGRFDLGQTS